MEPSFDGEPAPQAIPDPGLVSADPDRLDSPHLGGPDRTSYEDCVVHPREASVSRYVDPVLTRYRETHKIVVDNFELIATVFFDVEMIWRIGGYLPNWRQFNEKRQNYLDLFLVIITTIIQIPQIHHWKFYPWFTIFQLGRFYRVILAVPTMRPLLVSYSSRLETSS